MRPQACCSVAPSSSAAVAVRLRRCWHPATILCCSLSQHPHLQLQCMVPEGLTSCSEPCVLTLLIHLLDPSPANQPAHEQHRLCLSARGTRVCPGCIAASAAFAGVQQQHAACICILDKAARRAQRHVLFFPVLLCHCLVHDRHCILAQQQQQGPCIMAPSTARPAA